MKRYAILFPIALIFFVHGNYVLAQTPGNAIIDPENFDTRLMEYFVKIKVDSVRKAHGLNPLVNDTLLYLAARDQALYQVGKKELTHFQTNRRKKTLKDRLDYYHATYIAAAENLARGYVLVPVYVSGNKSATTIIKTYEQAARQMVDGWVHSKGHYANMITPGYKLTGVAIVFSKQKKEVNGAQVFADVPEGSKK